MTPTLGWDTPPGSGGGGGGAPTNATYILQTPNGSLGNAQALSALATGILKSTTATGVISIAAAGSDYVAPSTTITAGTGLTGGGDLTANRTISMPAVGPGSGTIGSAGISSITLDAQGRVTAATTATFLTTAAPVNAQYLTLAADATLTVERVFTPSSGLTAVDSGAGAAYTLTNDVLTGKSGGQTWTGGTASGDSLVIRSTSNATKGFTSFGATTTVTIDEVNKRIGVNNAAPDSVWTSGSTLGIQTVFGAGSAASFMSVQNATAGTFSGFVCGDSQAHTLRMYWSTDTTAGQISTGAGPLDIGPTGNLTFFGGKWTWTSGGTVTFGSGVNIALNTTTGTKIGTGATQKLGFYNATAIVQPATTGTSTGFTAGAGTAVNDASTFTGGTGSTAYRISDVVLALKNLGLMAA